MARFTDPDQIFSYCESFTNLERRTLSPLDREYRLDRMTRLLEHFGRPHAGLRCYHVAGTKGKGSTAAFLAAALRAEGTRAGLYLSPHVSSYHERISVAGEPVPPAVLLEAGDRIARELETGALDDLRGGFGPTTFELLTLLAFLCFREAGCSEAVIEVGIGGRLDATNVIDPIASLITPLDLEHTQLLGDTIADIAREKGGIIKPGRPAFVAAQEAEARDVLASIARERGAPLAFLPDRLRHLASSVSPGGTDVSLALSGEPPRRFRLAMPGRFQAENAALAYLALRETRPHTDPETFLRGMGEARLPGRMEIVASRPPLVLDAAHTPLATRRLLETFRELYPDPGILVFGSVSGKRHEEMARILAPAFRQVVITTPGTFKESDPEATWMLFRRYVRDARLERQPAAALELALSMAEQRLPVLVTGSFYLLGEIKAALAARPELLSLKPDPLIE